MDTPVLWRLRWRRSRADWGLRVAGLVTVGGATLATLLGFRAVSSDGRLGIEGDCSENAFTCGMGTGLGTTVLAVAVGFLFWRFLRTRRVVDIYRRQIHGMTSRRPWPRRAAGALRMVPRTDLVALVIEDLCRGGRRPQLIVGAIGTGKTCAMAHLKRELAAKRFVPVEVTLDPKAATDLDLIELAHEAFKRATRRNLW